MQTGVWVLQRALWDFLHSFWYRSEPSSGSASSPHPLALNTNSHPLRDRLASSPLENTHSHANWTGDTLSCSAGSPSSHLGSPGLSSPTQIITGEGRQVSLSRHSVGTFSASLASLQTPPVLFGESQNFTSHFWYKADDPPSPSSFPNVLCRLEKMEVRQGAATGSRMGQFCVLLVKFFGEESGPKQSWLSSDYKVSEASFFSWSLKHLSWDSRNNCYKQLNDMPSSYPHT